MGNERVGDEGYIVVFRGKGDGKSNYRGVVTWTSYTNKAQFDEMWENSDHTDEIVAEGITSREAIQLVRTTPIQAYVNAAIREATIDGEINSDILSAKLSTYTFLDPEKTAKHRRGN